MAYIGNTATTQAFTPAVDYFNGDGATVAFTLSKPVASVAQVQAVIENVPQNPGSAYTVSGNTITFTSAPPSGTSNIYVYYTSPITQVIAPSQGTVGTSILQDGSVTSAKLATLTTLPAPSSNTLTLPSASGVIDRLNRAGNVLQVVSATTAGTVSTSSTSFVQTGLEVSITPSSASSKILVIASYNMNLLTSGNWVETTLYRGATNVGATRGFNGIYFGNTVDIHTPASLVYLDSPNTTSATLYEIYIRANSSGTVNFNQPNMTTSIVAMEIAA
jgi:hypothetical protein